MPGPYLAEYVATKHYMHSFTEVPPNFCQLIRSNYKSKNALSFHYHTKMISPKVFCPQSLALEVEGSGVVIQEMDPGVVITEMTKVIARNIGD